MAITVDNSVARVDNLGAAAVTSGTFNATNGQCVLVTTQLDQNSQPYAAATISNNGVALTWTNIQNLGAANTGTVAAWYTVLSADRTGLTVTITRGDVNADSPTIKVYVLTNQNATVLGAQTNNTSTTNNLTTTGITPITDGVGFGIGNDYTQAGAPTSTDLTNFSTYDMAGNISGGTGYKSLTTGVSATANFDAAGTAAGNWRYLWVEIRAAAAASVTAAQEIGIFDQQLSGQFVGLLWK